MNESNNLIKEIIYQTDTKKIEQIIIDALRVERIDKLINEIDPLKRLAIQVHSGKTSIYEAIGIAYEMGLHDGYEAHK